MSTALDLLDGLRLEDGRTWGSAATAIQRADAEAVLDVDSPIRFHFLSRARGYSKTTDAGAIDLVALLTQAPAGSKSYAVAADQDQARLLLDSVEGFVRRTAGLMQLVDVAASKIVVRETGASLEALAADAASSWGLRPFLVVADELSQWPETAGPRRLWEALTTSVPKTGGRLVVITTAGSPGHFAKRVRDHAATDPVWRLSEASGPPPWTDEALLAEQKRRLPEGSYRRLFENEWTSGEDSLVTEEDLHACAVLDGPLQPVSGQTYVCGLDIGLKKDRTVAAICHQETGRVFLDRMQVWSGTRLHPVRLDDVEAWIAQAAREYAPLRVVADPWQSAQLTQRLRAAHVRIDEHPFSEASISRITSTLFGLLREHALQLPDDEALLDELLNVRLVAKPSGLLRLEHASDRHDDRAVALALAAHTLVQRRQGPAIVSVHQPKGRIDGRRPVLRIADVVERAARRRSRVSPDAQAAGAARARHTAKLRGPQAPGYYWSGRNAPEPSVASQPAWSGLVAHAPSGVRPGEVDLNGHAYTAALADALNIDAYDAGRGRL